MSAQVCPYLGTAEDPGAYFATPDAANCCYAVSPGGPAHIRLDFQGSTCLAGQAGLCSRYKAAETLEARPPTGRWLMVGGGLVSLAVFAGCAFLAVLVLILGGLGASRLGLLARATDTLPPTATPSPSLTWTATTSLTPTEQITNTATVAPEPSTPTATVSPVDGPGGALISPLATPMWQPTATRPVPIATQPPRTATQPWPTATRGALPTATLTRGPTLTPSVTSTRTPTATPLMNCRTDDTMTFNPTSPLAGKAFVIEVRSLMGYVEVSLTGGDGPWFNEVDRSGNYYIWRWEDRVQTGGTYSYSFKIKNGAATCLTRSVTVVAPTNTPAPTPTFAPVYGLKLELSPDDDFRPIYTDTERVVFEFKLTNTGNVTDTFEVEFRLDAAPPEGWTVQFCIGDSCSDDAYATQVTLPEGELQALSIKVSAAADAKEKDDLSATLSVQSLGDAKKKESRTVTVEVRKPTPP